MKHIQTRTRIFLATAMSIAATLPAQSQGAPGMEIKTEDGGLFMEEVESKRPDAKSKPIEMKHAPDFSDLGVSVDQEGKIVPLIQHGAPPVMEMGDAKMFAGNETPWGNSGMPWGTMPVLPYATPYGPRYAAPWQYGYPSYPMAPYAVPYAGLNLRLGNVGINIGTPLPSWGGYGYGAPWGGYGMGGYGAPWGGYGMGGYGAPWGGYGMGGYGAPWRGYGMGYGMRSGLSLAPALGIAPPLGYSPMMYSDNALGAGLKFNSSYSGSGLLNPFGYRYRSSWIGQ